MPRVAIIGAGISGLAAGFRLSELAAARRLPLEIVVLESASRLGGTIDTIHNYGFVMETGADSFISEKPWAIELARRLGIDKDLLGTQEQFRKTFVVRRGKLEQIPDGFSLIAPGRLAPMFRSPIFSLRGKLRAAIEPAIPKRKSTDDESLSSFVSRRLGREILERLAQPLAGGIYTANPEQLSMQATLSRFIAFERRYGSVIRGLHAERNKTGAATAVSGARWSLFLSFAGGMRSMIAALAERLGEAIRLELPVEELRPGESASGWRLSLGGGTRLDADAVICSIPSYAAARIVERQWAALAASLRAISYSSAATVNLAYRLGDFPEPPQSFGFVVPEIEKRKIIACSFSSRKFAGRAPADTILLRVFIGGALQNQMMELDDDEMVAAAHDEISSLLGVSAAPILAYVARMADSMPQYSVGHLDRVRAVEQAASAMHGLFLAGAYLHGVGIPDCIRSGELAAEAATEFIARQASNMAGRRVAQSA